MPRTQLSGIALTNKNLIGYWGLNEGSGTFAADGSGNGMHGSITGATYTTVGDITALDFDGVDDFVTINHHARQLVTTGFSVSAWIRPDTLGEASRGRILDKSTSSAAAGGFAFTLQPSNRFGVQVNAGTIVLSEVNSVTPNGTTWYHVVSTVASNATVTNYVNGAVSGTPAATGALAGITTTQSMRIGNRSTATDVTFDGLIDELRFYNTALIPAQVLLLTNNRNNVGRYLVDDRVQASGRVQAEGRVLIS